MCPSKWRKSSIAGVEPENAWEPVPVNSASVVSWPVAIWIRKTVPMLERPPWLVVPHIKPAPSGSKPAVGNAPRLVAPLEVNSAIVVRLLVAMCTLNTVPKSFRRPLRGAPKISRSVAHQSGIRIRAFVGGTIRAKLCRLA